MKFLYKKGALFKCRFLIAGLLFVLCVAMGVTGSSIGVWCSYFDVDETNLIFGVSRTIRSDEWAVFTPMTWSQYYDANGAFSYFSSVIRGSSTDVFLEYGQPVASWLMVFRPFYLGYLFLPIENGMAFFWCGRFIALFVVSFEFGRLITNDKRLISLVYTFLISLSPAVQWWFAINGLVEMLIYIELSILAMRAFMRTRSSLKRVGLTFLIAICAGGYILAMYPAWQIPFAYVLLALFIWTLRENKSQCKMRRRDWIIVVLGIAFLAASMTYVLYLSKDTIVSIMNTVYPGTRSETGGGMLNYLFNYACSMWFALIGEAPVLNTCEMAYFIDLFPICYIIPLAVCIKNRRSDFMSAVLLLVSAFLGTYCIFGFPEIFSKITLLSNSTANRALVAFTFCNVIILIRGISRLDAVHMELRVKYIVPLCGLCFVAVWCAYKINPDYYSIAMVMVMLLIFGCIFIFSVYLSRKCILAAWSCMLIGLSVISGGIVNPVRIGISDVAQIPELQMIRNVVEKDESALWVVEGSGLPINNFGLLAGAPTINSTNVYPDLERWEMIDTNGKHEEVYNRYAHITVNVKNSGDAEFELLSPDLFSVTLTVSDLKKIGVTYIFTQNTLDEMYTGSSVVAECNGWRVYKIE